MRGIPHAVLVDASGTVIWKGHPGGIEESMIRQAVEGALPKPLWEWTGAAKGAKKALLKRSYKAALDQAAKLGENDDGPEILAAIQGIVKSRSQALQSSIDKGDYLGAVTAAKAMQKEMAGLPEQGTAKEALSTIAADKEAQSIIKGQKKLAKLDPKEKLKGKAIVKAIADLRKLKKSYPGTFIEEDADRVIAKLNGMASMR